VAYPMGKTYKLAMFLSIARSIIVAFRSAKEAEQRYFRGAKGDSYFPHDAYRFLSDSSSCRGRPPK